MNFEFVSSFDPWPVRESAVGPLLSQGWYAWPTNTNEWMLCMKWTNRLKKIYNLIYIKMLQYIYMRKLCTFRIPSQLLQMFHPLHFSSIQSSATVLAFVVSALAATQLAPQLRAVGADFPLPRLIAGKQQGIRMDQCIEWGTHGTGTYWYPILRPRHVLNHWTSMVLLTIWPARTGPSTSLPPRRLGALGDAINTWGLNQPNWRFAQAKCGFKTNKTEVLARQYRNWIDKNRDCSSEHAESFIKH